MVPISSEFNDLGKLLNAATEFKAIAPIFKSAITIKMKDTAVQQEINKHVAGQRAILSSLLSLQKMSDKVDVGLREASQDAIDDLIGTIKLNAPLLAMYEGMKKEEFRKPSELQQVRREEEQ